MFPALFLNFWVDTESEKAWIVKSFWALVHSYLGEINNIFEQNWNIKYI